MEAEQQDLRRRLELGLIPDNELRQLLKIRFQKLLQQCYKPTHELQLAEILNSVHSLRQMEIATKTDLLNSQSYEMPASLLQYIFGSYLKDSCSYFKDGSMSIDEAEIEMMDLYCERAQIKDGQSVLDLGCGWGATTLYIANKFKNSHVTAITNSMSQKGFIEEKLKKHKLSNVKVILADISTYEMEETFDRVIVIEVFEHMKNYELLLRKISKWMTKDGLLFVQHVCYKNFVDISGQLVHEDYDWFNGYLFPAGTIVLPSASMLLYFQDDVTVINHWTLSGEHYACCGREWLKRLDANSDAIIRSFSGGKEEAKKVVYYWRVYTIFVMEYFGYNNGEEIMVSHVLFRSK